MSDDKLEKLLRQHAEAVSESAKAWSAMIDAQKLSAAARKAEHKTKEAIEEHLSQKVSSYVRGDLNPLFDPVNISL